jgi:hypothetical protein
MYRVLRLFGGRRHEENRRHFAPRRYYGRRQGVRYTYGR